MADITRYGDVPPQGFIGLQRLNRMLDEAFSTWPFQQGGGVVTAAWVPACDVCEDTNSITLSVELPGVRPEDVKLTVENNILTIRGEKRQEKREEREQMHRYERSYGSFERTFALPSTVDPEHIDANYENGILNITIAKAERARPREIPVNAAGGGKRQVKAGTGEGKNREQRTSAYAS
jgi:HSP20 family protein